MVQSECVRTSQFVCSSVVQSKPIDANSVHPDCSVFFHSKAEQHLGELCAKLHEKEGGHASSIELLEMVCRPAFKVADTLQG